MTGLPQPETCDERAVDRRAFLGRSLILVGGAALIRIPFANAAPSADLDSFLQLSRVATGVEALPRRLASEYLKALDKAPQLKLKPSEFLREAGYAHGKGPMSLRALERSVPFKTKGGRQCVDAIVAAWWSGMVPAAAGGQRVVTFSDALVWRVVHEPTTCQGATGSWAKPGRAAL